MRRVRNMRVLPFAASLLLAAACGLTEPEGHPATGIPGSDVESGPLINPEVPTAMIELALEAAIPTALLDGSFIGRPFQGHCWAMDDWGNLGGYVLLVASHGQPWLVFRYCLTKRFGLWYIVEGAVTVDLEAPMILHSKALTIHWYGSPPFIRLSKTCAFTATMSGDGRVVTLRYCGHVVERKIGR